MPEHHSILGCSSSAQWIACPGSVEAQRQFKTRYPDVDVDNPASIWGTHCHAVAEWFLSGPERAKESITDAELGDAGLLPDVSDLIEMAWNFRTYCLGLVVDGAEFATEQRVSVGAVHEVCFGTVDFLTIDFARLHADLADLKTGRNAVYAEDNAQLQMYAQGVREYVHDKYDLDLKTLTLRIFGPRFAKGISEWTITTKQLDRFVERARRQAEIALSPNAPRVPGDTQCRYCLSEPTCKARDNQLFDLLAGEFDEFEDATEMSPDERARWVLRADAIKRFLDKVQAVSRIEALEGTPLPGLKLVTGQVRYAPQEQAIHRVIGDKLYASSVQKMRSKSDLKRTLSKSEFTEIESLFDRVDGKPLLVDATDGRKEVSVESIEDAFADMS